MPKGSLRSVYFYIVSTLQASKDLLNEHYIDLKEKPFFPTLIKYMSSGPVVAMVSVVVYKTGLLSWSNDCTSR